MGNRKVLRTEYDFKGSNRDDSAIYYYREDGTVSRNASAAGRALPCV